MNRMTYIGAEVIVSPLGYTASDNWAALSANRSGITLAEKVGFNQEDIHLSQIVGLAVNNRFEQLVNEALNSVQKLIDKDILRSDRTIVILSSTKGALDTNVTDPFGSCVTSITSNFNLANTPIVISNACISGVLAINVAGNFIEQKLYDHAVVIGCDVISKFVLYGFQSLFAISDKPCMPFDATRNGITLGEGCGVVVVSSERNIFKKTPLELLSGASANDANHISGPSRTGEGLVRSVSKTLKINAIDPSEIDFISAHGTATVFNDEMEAIAFDRVALSHVPMNSFKGYFGHTLGAAGIIETAASMQMIRNETLVKSLGFSQSGTSKSLNIIDKNRKASLKNGAKNSFRIRWGQCFFDYQKYMSFITAYCHLNQDFCSLNGKIIARRDKESQDPWLKQIYKDQEFAYPKFHKMDTLSQAGFLGSELIKRAVPSIVTDYQDDEVALIFANSSSSADTDLRFIGSYEQNSSPSPSLFVYTLPNIVLGELAILNKWYGENMFAVLPKFVPDFFLNYTQILLAGGSKAALCGWLEILGDRIDAFLFLVEKEALHAIEFNRESLESLIAAGPVGQ